MNEFTVDHPIRRSRRLEDGAARCWALGHRLVLGLSLTLACQCALAQVMYRITTLGYLDGVKVNNPAAGFNRLDEVAGTGWNTAFDQHAWLWKNNGKPMVDLGPPEVGSTSEAIGLNASGVVTGQANDSTGYFAFESSGDGTPITRIYDGLGGSLLAPTGLNDLGQLTGYAYTTGDSVWHAFVWKNDGTPMLDLGTFGGDYSIGNAINASGQVAGTSDLPGSTLNNPLHHAFFWKNDGAHMVDLGTLGGNLSDATLVNASGQVAGVSRVIQNLVVKNHAFFWRNDGTPMQDLGTLGGRDSHPSALNDSGQIAGYAYTKGLKTEHAFVWMNNGTPMKDLGTLGGTQSAANDVNSSGQVAGYATLAGDKVFHAFLWRNDGTKIQDLNTLIDPTDPLKPYITLTNGDFINDRGDILAEGTDSRNAFNRLFLLQGTVLTLAPRSLAFGNQPIKTASAAKSVTVRNTSAKAVAIASIALTGTSAGQFATTNNCGNSLAGHAICTIKVTFKPTTKGAKSATLSVNGGGGGLRVVSLTGMGT